MTARQITIFNQDDKARVIRKIELATLKDKAGNYLQVTVKRRRRKRTLSQNNLYWAWVHIMAEHCGSTDEEMHNDLKMQLLPKHERVNKITGEVVMEPISTTRLETVVMSEYMGRIQALAIDHFDIVLPTPDDPDSFDAYEQTE